MVPKEATTLSTNTTTDNGIMDKQNTGNDNAHTDTRAEDNTPEKMQRNDTTKTKATSAMEKQEQCNTGKDATSKKRTLRRGLLTPRAREKQTSRN